MDKKVIQEKRIKAYFIEAARKIIKEEGVKNLTVKKVAALAGYAPGTLYNYFADLNTLFFYCAADFWKECKKEVLEKGNNTRGIRERVINFSRAYAEYFIDNPNIFQLIFLEDIGDVPEELGGEVTAPEVALLLQEVLIECAREGIIPRDKVTILENLIGSSIHGILLFYIKERSPLSKEEILGLIEEELDYLLGV